MHCHMMPENNWQYLQYLKNLAITVIYLMGNEISITFTKTICVTLLDVI
jgi:hypothetical protein